MGGGVAGLGTHMCCVVVNHHGSFPKLSAALEQGRPHLAQSSALQLHAPSHAPTPTPHSPVGLRVKRVSGSFRATRRPVRARGTRGRVLAGQGNYAFVVPARCSRGNMTAGGNSLKRAGTGRYGPKRWAFVQVRGEPQVRAVRGAHCAGAPVVPASLSTRPDRSSPAERATGVALDPISVRGLVRPAGIGYIRTSSTGWYASGGAYARSARTGRVRQPDNAAR
jgi:hypothetical protein